MQRCFIGIDVSKRFHIARQLGAEQGNGKPFRFTHGRSGFDAFKKWVRDIAPAQPLVMGLEPTGQFSNILAVWLRSEGWPVRMVPGVHVRRAKYLFTSGGIKNDDIDAMVIAQLLQSDPDRYKDQVQRTQVFVELRELAEQYLRWSKLWIQALNRTHSLTELLWPEFCGQFNLKTKSARAILERWPAPELLCATPFREFRDLAYSVARGKLSDAHLRQVYDAAQTSIAGPGYSYEALGELEKQLQLLAQLEAFNQEAQRAMRDYLGQIEYGSNLQTIPGIKHINAGMVLGYLGDLRDYPHVRCVYKAAGLNLTEQSSGQWIGRPHIERTTGSPIVRRYLYQAAQAACSRKHGLLRPWYEQRASQGKPRKKVIVAGMRLLLRVMHAVARDNAPFCTSRFLPGNPCDAVGAKTP